MKLRHIEVHCIEHRNHSTSPTLIYIYIYFVVVVPTISWNLKNFYFRNLHLHILNSFWVLHHITIYSIYIIEFGYLSPKHPILLFQTLQVVFNVGCIVTILNLHPLLSWIHSFPDTIFFPFTGYSFFVLKHIFWELGPLDSQNTEL